MFSLLVFRTVLDHNKRLKLKTDSDVRHSDVRCFDAPELTYANTVLEM